MDTYVSIYGTIDNPLVKLYDISDIIETFVIRYVKLNKTYNSDLTLEEAYDFFKDSRRWTIAKKFKEWVLMMLYQLKITNIKKENIIEPTYDWSGIKGYSNYEDDPFTTTIRY